MKLLELSEETCHAQPPAIQKSGFARLIWCGRDDEGILIFCRKHRLVACSPVKMGLVMNLLTATVEYSGKLNIEYSIDVLK